MPVKIHPLADVQSANIGDDTMIWQFAIVLSKATIGSNCNINCHTFIENDVSVGNNVTIKSGVYLWDGITIEDNVFVGPNVTFTNDKVPRSKVYPTEFQRTIIKHHASIGAAAVVMGGTTIGEFALIGAGSVVTKDVPPHALVIGNPATICGWVDERGDKLKQENGFWWAKNGEKFSVENNVLTKL